LLTDLKNARRARFARLARGVSLPYRYRVLSLSQFAQHTVVFHKPHGDNRYGLRDDNKAAFAGVLLTITLLAGACGQTSASHSASSANSNSQGTSNSNSSSGSSSSSSSSGSSSSSSSGSSSGSSGFSIYRAKPFWKRCAICEGRHNDAGKLVERLRRRWLFPGGFSSGPPSYASFSQSNATVFTWAASQSDVRDFPVPGAGRIAASWYNNTSFGLNLSLNDGNVHLVALYALDYDNRGRVETIQIVDPATNNVVSSQVLSNFSNGVI